MLEKSKLFVDRYGADRNDGSHVIDRLIGMADLGRIPAPLLEAFMTKLEFLTKSNLVRASRDPNDQEAKEKQARDNSKGNPVLNAMRATAHAITHQTGAILTAGITLFAASPLLARDIAPKTVADLEQTNLRMDTLNQLNTMTLPELARLDDPKPTTVALTITAPPEERVARLAIGDPTISPSFKEVAAGRVGPLAPLSPVPQMVVPGAMTGLSQTFEGQAGMSLTHLSGTIGTITMEPGFTPGPQHKIEVVNPLDLPWVNLGPELAPH